MTKIMVFERQTQGRVHAVFDNGTECLLYRSECAQLKLEEGRVLSSTEYDFLVKELLGKRAIKRAMHLLTQQDRSEHQLREKLQRGGYPAECIERAVEYVRSYGYLDDRRLAANYVRLTQDGQSRMQISRRLTGRGIAREVIREVLEEEYSADELQQARRLLERRRFDAETADEKEVRRNYAFLARRGFSGGCIRKAMGFCT